MKKIYGKEEEVPLSSTEAWLSKGLRKYVEVDKFGVYKKEGVRIPWFYKFEYSRNKRHRKLLIRYYYERLDNFSELDKMEMEKLLRMG